MLDGCLMHPRFALGLVALGLASLAFAACGGGDRSSSHDSGGSDSGGSNIGGSQRGGTDSGTGGSEETGGTASAGAPSGGAASGGSSGEAGSGGGGTGGATQAAGTATLGTSCDAPGTLVCAGTYQKLGLVCGASFTWETNVTCAGAQLCDTREGVTRGSCQDPPAECVGKEPGERYCDDWSVYECNVDTLDTALVEECPHGCKAGACAVVADACSSEIDADCSKTCGPAYGNGASCENGACPLALAQNITEPPATVRTPAAVDGCEAECGARTFEIYLPPYLAWVRVKVAPAWQMLSVPIGDPLPNVCTAEKATSCLVFPPDLSSTPRVVLVANDDTPPARNVLIETSSEELACP